VTGLANGGTDLQNCIKQAAEFQLAQRGHRLATPFVSLPDVLSLGQEICQGLVLANSFYWALSPKTKAWSERFVARMNKPPTEYNAGAYAGVLHWLTAVKALGTLDVDAVAAKMLETPVNDFYNENIRIQPNDAVTHTMYACEVKNRRPGDHKWDVFSRVATVSSPNAFAPPDLFGCSLVKA
jgi:branched-chain amino acid transport system substrate-binding protein